MTVEIKWEGVAAKQRMKRGAGQGVFLAAEHVLGEARQEVPIEDAILSRSGAASVDDAQMVAAVSFDTPYAVKQHEDMTLRHDPGRKAKYLEDPLHDTRGDQERIIARSVGGEFE